MGSKAPFQDVLVVSDHGWLLGRLAELFARRRGRPVRVAYARSPGPDALPADLARALAVRVCDVRAQAAELARAHDLILSLHCRQVFPAALVRTVRCINVHPGLNPHNRGWYPQVFSILNGKPCGATIHEMDEQIDHGAIVAQQEVPLTEADTSLTAYERVVAAEAALLERWLEPILANDYPAVPPAGEGNYNGKRDFAALCRLDLQKRGTFGEFLTLLRALSHGPHRNAWYETREGRRVHVTLQVHPS